MTFFLFIFFQTFAQNSNEIRSSTQIIEGLRPNQSIEVQYNFVPKKMLPQMISEVLKKEKIDRLTISYNERPKELALKQDLEAKISNQESLVRTINEKSLPSEGPNLLTNKEVNNYRIMLLIRTAGLGVGLYISTGSSISIAAYGAIFNYLMMEALYIPNRKGQMRGVDFVSNVMKKAADSAKRQSPNISNRRMATIEGFTNFLTNYTMNVAMLIPFVGMTGADFSLYLDSFLKIETYQRSISIGIMTTAFMASWKMAVSRWEELKRERGIEVASRKLQSRYVNGVDFFLSFINPGFWAGNTINQVIVTTVGVSGWVAYFYYDLKEKFKNKMNPFSQRYQQKLCRRLF